MGTLLSVVRVANKERRLPHSSILLVRSQSPSERKPSIQASSELGRVVMSSSSTQAASGSRQV